MSASLEMNGSMRVVAANSASRFSQSALWMPDSMQKCPVRQSANSRNADAEISAMLRSMDAVYRPGSGARDFNKRVTHNAHNQYFLGQLQVSR
jgi:hypothetical protein